MRRSWMLPHTDSLLWTLVAIVVIWQVWIAVGHVDALVAPSPGAVAADILKNPVIYLSSTGLTLLVALIGLVLGMCLGVVFALLAYFSPLLRGVVTPLATVIRTIPVVAIIPVIARLLGYGENTLVGVAVVISFFPAFVLVSSGLRDLPAGSSDLFAVMGAGRFTRLARLALPSAVPNALVALRLTAAACIVVAVLSEYLIGSDGLGFVLATARAYHLPDRAWGVAAITTCLAVTAFLNVSRLERWGRQRWR
ncbi:MAG: ABC transporter permease subunit [Chloroflexi bacterium]|nr:ABC transporter permease subunit [Chloroflexota bacterium]